MAKTKSIAQQDKELMDLQAQIERKEAQLKQDYRRLAREVKHNPDLQAAVDEYKNYFAEQKTEKDKQLKALTVLLKHIEANAVAVEANAVAVEANANAVARDTNAVDTNAVDTNTDANAIKREIMAIHRKK
jgi:hypothetical protein